ncbi:hypothetical protein OHC33_004930 [Knufia fluminis]|uniref:F-box domain-containing protein n=1 Tax=Knufia fluminis TaxID=191047 RepID=A0AAN8EKS8_9EURO|nr:hypothetical protein OHC33_004930 [Knufia fluminis]
MADTKARDILALDEGPTSACAPARHSTTQTLHLLDLPNETLHNILMLYYGVWHLGFDGLFLQRTPSTVPLLVCRRFRAIAETARLKAFSGKLITHREWVERCAHQHFMHRKDEICTQINPSISRAVAFFADHITFISSDRELNKPDSIPPLRSTFKNLQCVETKTYKPRSHFEAARKFLWEGAELTDILKRSHDQTLEKLLTKGFSSIQHADYYAHEASVKRTYKLIGGLERGRRSRSQTWSDYLYLLVS